MFDKSNYKVGGSVYNSIIDTNIYSKALGFDLSNLTMGKKYTFSSDKPIYRFKISNSADGYSSVQAASNQFPNGITKYSFTMSRHANISATTTQYIFIKVMTSSGEAWVTDISQLEGYNIQIEEGETATEYTPYGKYRVPIKLTNVDGKYQTHYLFIDNSLKREEYIDFKTRKVVRTDGTTENVELPELSTFEDYTKIEVLTELKPSKIEVEYTGYTLD